MNPYLQIQEEEKATGVQPLESVLPAPAMPSTQDLTNPYLSMQMEDKRRAQGVPRPGSEEPQSILDTMYQSGQMAAQYAQGAVHGIMQGWEDAAHGLGGGVPMEQLPDDASLSEKIAQIPRFAINMMTGGKGATEALRGAEITDYASPLTDVQRQMPEGSAPTTTSGPVTPMEQLGADTSLIPAMLLGGGAAKGAKALGQAAEMRRAVKQITKGSEAQIEAVPDLLRDKARPEGLPRGMTDEKAKELLNAVDDSRELATTQVLEPFMDRVAKGSLEGYRTRLLKAFDGVVDPTLVPDKIKNNLLAWEGMSAKEFMRWRKMVSNRAKRPDSKFHVDTPAAKQRRRMYSEVLNAMDEHLDKVLPPEGVMKQWGEGMEMYKMLRRWDEAKRIFVKGIDWKDGERIYNSNKVLKELSKLDDRKVRELFGADMSKAMKILKASAKSTAAARRDAAQKAHGSWLKWASAAGIGTAVSTMLLGRTGPVQSGVRELLGGSAEVGHTGLGR